MNLRPTPMFVQATASSMRDDDFVFSRHPIIVSSYVDIPSDIDSGDETDPEDHEARIRTSWHHRALLGDENRTLYNDFKDTNFEDIEKKMELRDRLLEETDDATVVF